MLVLNLFSPPSPPLAGVQQCLCPNPSSQWSQRSARGTEPSLGRVGVILPRAGKVSGGLAVFWTGNEIPCQQLSHSLLALLCPWTPSLAFINHTGPMLWLSGFVHGALVL